MNLPVMYNLLSWQERRDVRLEYIKRQEGKCSHCLNPLDGPATPQVNRRRINKKLFPKNFFQYPVHLHHSHKTGMTIGAVHCKCNAYMWQYKGE
jgi:hypothetical protein